MATVFKGWIRSILKSKDITFVHVYHGLQQRQLVINTDAKVEGELKVGASFTCKGTDVSNNKSPGGIDTNVTEFKIIGPSDDDYLIQPKEHSMEFLRTIPDLRGRARSFQVVWELRKSIQLYLAHYVNSKGFQRYTPPILIGGDFEGPGQAFKAICPWWQTDLTVSSQLHLEVGMMSMGNVFSLTPCFRAEKSKGRRHLAEFWMLEAESPFKERHEIMEECQYIVNQTIRSIMLNFPQYSRELGRESTLPGWTAVSKWPRITYKQVTENYEVAWGEDIDHKVEMELCKKYNGPVFVTDHPAIMKPFYMKQGDEETVKSFDLILPEVGEIAGGSAREEDYDKLKAVMEERGLTSSLEWYLNTRKWGTVPHAGFGIGVDRLVMFLTGMKNIRDVIPIPIAY